MSISEEIRSEIIALVEAQTEKKVKCVSRISFSTFLVETEDGETYKAR